MSSGAVPGAEPSMRCCHHPTSPLPGSLRLPPHATALLGSAGSKACTPAQSLVPIPDGLRVHSMGDNQPFLPLPLPSFLGLGGKIQGAPRCPPSGINSLLGPVWPPGVRHNQRLAAPGSSLGVTVTGPASGCALLYGPQSPHLGNDWHFPNATGMTGDPKDDLG